MSTNKFDNLRNVCKGRTDWKIKVRVIREWRGKTASGEPFTNYNMLLLDAKNCRMQAFVPAFLNEKLQRMLQLGKMYVTSFFQVRDFTPEDKWRSVQLDRQIQFTNQTKTRELSESEYFIPNNMFDFYDFEEVRKLAKQNIYLADEYDISNFSPTTFYINYNHHSVAALRKMIPNFNEDMEQTKSIRPLQSFTVAQIKNLNSDYLNENVVCHVTIKHVQEIPTWFYSICTSCYKQIKLENEHFYCPNCNRIVPEPDKRFEICVTAFDNTGEIGIVLMDRPIRTLFGKRVYELQEEVYYIIVKRRLDRRFWSRTTPVSLILVEVLASSKSGDAAVFSFSGDDVDDWRRRKEGEGVCVAVHQKRGRKQSLNTHLVMFVSPDFRRETSPA
ncbi:uncharacterized protein LOC141714333 [Apium graveolens]|uniref:uncharacterized protein LOC141714333 n=1 Tax=Apium graveolens TaxID=4045 RepID=UPI003D7A6BA4